MVSSNNLAPEQDAQLRILGQWVIETCLLFGTQRKTAYMVAGVFVEGVEKEWRAPDRIEQKEGNRG